VALQPPKPGLKGLSNPTLDARAREEQERQDRHRTEDLLEECGKVEEDLEKLKARFELYFVGIDRREPAREREEMKRRVGRLKGEFTRNTGLRFRIETLHARFLSYERMWTRSAREKEEGTYRRDLLRVRRKAELEERGEPQKRKEAVPAGAAAPTRDAAPPASSPDKPAIAAAPAARPAPVEPAPAPVGAATARLDRSAPAPQPPPGGRPAALPPGMSEDQLRALYSAYVEAKKRCNEDVSRVSYETLARTVAKQVPEIVSKYKAKTVEFKVVIKDGRAILKAVPRL
jgi:hypothetical protein